MKLVTFTHSKRTRIGVVVDEMVVDLSESAPELPLTMLERARARWRQKSCAIIASIGEICGLVGI